MRTLPKKHHLKISLISAFIIVVLCCCHSEIRTYKRVGGNHLHLTENKKELFWFSGMHGYDPENPMFKDIETEFQKFNPDLVLVEGLFAKSKFDDKLSAIKHGESAFVTYLANKNNITCQDIEPSDSILNIYLTGKYGKEDVMSMYIIRQMVQWGRDPGQIKDIENTIVKYAEYTDETIHLFDEEINIDLISKLLFPYTKINSLNQSNWTDFDAHKFLYFQENKINEIWRETANYRNIYLIALLKEKKKEYDRIFIMMGFDHAKETMNELLQLYNVEGK